MERQGTRGLPPLERKRGISNVPSAIRAQVRDQATSLEVPYVTGTARKLLQRRPIRPLPPEFAFMHGSRLCAVTLPPDGVLLVDTTTGAELASLPAGPHILWGETFSPDDRFLVAASTDHHILIWDFAMLRHELRELGLDW